MSAVGQCWTSLNLSQCDLSQIYYVQTTGFFLFNDWHIYNLITLYLSDYLVNVPYGEGDEADDNGGDEGAGEGQATHPVHKLISIHTTTIR